MYSSSWGMNCFQLRNYKNLPNRTIVEPLGRVCALERKKVMGF